MLVTNKTIPAIFNKIRQGSTMLVVKNYKNRFDEIATHTFVFHVNYNKALVKSINIWKSIKANNPIEQSALNELIASAEDSLNGNSRSTSAHAYTKISDGTEIIKGVKYHPNNQQIHLYGFRVRKKIIAEGIYPVVNSSPKTLAKNKFRKMAPVGKFVQFRIDHDQFENISVEKMKLLPEDLDKDLI